jgi:hypothetical protein
MEAMLDAVPDLRPTLASADQPNSPTSSKTST